MTQIQIAIFVVLGAVLAVSVVTDVRTRKILNIVTFPGMGVFLLMRFVAGLKAGAILGTATGVGLTSGLIGLAIGFVVFFVMNAMGGMGMGDVKLTAAVGAAVGFPTILACLAFIAVSGGIQAFLTLVWRGKLLSTFGGMGRKTLEKLKITKPANTQRENSYIPYGVAIAVGTVWGVWWTMSQAAAAQQ